MCVACVSVCVCVGVEGAESVNISDYYIVGATCVSICLDICSVSVLSHVPQGHS